MDKTNKDIIIKDNDLIESSYHLTKIQQKIMLYVISQMNKPNNGYKIGNDIVIDFDLHSIIGKILPDTNNHLCIIQNLDKLSLKKIIIRNNNNTKQQTDTHTGWIRDFDHKPNQSQITVYIRDKLEPYFLHLKSFFTTYYLDSVISFNNKYSFRIYELCKQYLPIGSRKLSIQELRNYLKCEDKYIQYSHFRDKVILPSMKDINDKSDMLVSYETTKKRKTTTHITFYMKSKTKPKISSNHKINDLGLSEEKKIEIFNLYINHRKEMNETIDFLLNRKDKIKHLPSYGYKVLKTEIEEIKENEKDKIKDIPKIHKDMKLKNKKTDTEWIVMEGNVIRKDNDKNEKIIMGEGNIIQGILNKTLDIIK